MLNERSNKEFIVLTPDEAASLGTAVEVDAFGRVMRQMTPAATWGEDGFIAMVVEQRRTIRGDFVPYMVFVTNPGCNNCGEDHFEKVETVPVCLN